MAESRLNNLIEKLGRGQLMKRYEKGIKDLCAKGYARRLADDEIRCHHSRVSYVPHFAVLNPHKPDKLRIKHNTMPPQERAEGASMHKPL